MTVHEHISLGQLASRIENALSDSSLREVWITAEINNLSVNNSSGHAYLELIERDPIRGQTIAQIKATIWVSRYKMIANFFAESTGSHLTSGMKILCKATVSYHPLYNLAINITDIDPAYTIGETERQKNLTIATLKQEGIFDMNRELELSELPQRLAIISSSTAAGYGDFMHQIENSPFALHTTLFPAVMQGAAAEASITTALTLIAEQETDFDCVIIIRGGGATTDLQCFDSYAIASYIAQMPLPVITGIGHERDTTVADLVAHTSLKTPTAVAAFLISTAENLYNSLLYFHRKIIDIAQNTLLGQSARLAALSTNITSIATNTLSAHSLKILRLSTSISSQSTQTISSQSSHLSLLQERFKSSATHQIASQFQKIKHLKELAAAQNPRRILALGYSIITTNDGKILKNTASIKPNDTIIIETAEALINTTVISKKLK